MASKNKKPFMLNISRAVIHDGMHPCGNAKRIKTENIKWFDSYEDAVNYYEGECKKGIPCGICMKNYDK